MNFDPSFIQENSDVWLNKIIDMSLNATMAITILVIGIFIAKLVCGLLQKAMTARSVDPTVSGFVHNIAYAALVTFVILAALAEVGIQTASFIAILGAAGLAVGLALQGSLSNFSAGVLLILFRPFKSGDFISAAGESGTVEQVQIFTTLLKTPDNRAIIIPNANILGGNIINFSAKPTRRVDLTIGVSYDSNLAQVKSVLQDILKNEERILPEPEPVVAVQALADSSVNFVVRPWVKSPDYWGVYFDLTQRIKERFDEEGIGIPYPQMDLHLISNQTGQPVPSAQTPSE